MSDFSHSHRLVHEHKISHTLAAIQLQNHILSHPHQIKQRIDQEFNENPALELKNERDVFKKLEPREADDDWNDDYGKPLDEYDTGDFDISQNFSEWNPFDICTNLEQAATQRFFDVQSQLENSIDMIDNYRVCGRLPSDANFQLHEDIEENEGSITNRTFPSTYPTFEVMVENNCVIALAFPSGHKLRYIRDIRGYTNRAKIFINHLKLRDRILNELADIILNRIQGDFFRQKQFKLAIRQLIPFPLGKLKEIKGSVPFKTDAHFFSKLGDHLVSCHFGNLPMNMFLQDKAAIIRSLLAIAREEGVVTRKEQIVWIASQMEERSRNWDSDDLRHELIEPLMKLTVDDIKYARKVESRR